MNKKAQEKPEPKVFDAQVKIKEFDAKIKQLEAQINMLLGAKAVLQEALNADSQVFSKTSD